MTLSQGSRHLVQTVQYAAIICWLGSDENWLWVLFFQLDEQLLSNCGMTNSFFSRGVTDYVWSETKQRALYTWLLCCLALSGIFFRPSSRRAFRSVPFLTGGLIPLFCYSIKFLTLPLSSQLPGLDFRMCAKDSLSLTEMIFLNSALTAQCSQSLSSREPLQSFQNTGRSTSSEAILICKLNRVLVIYQQFILILVPSDRTRQYMCQIYQRNLSATLYFCIGPGSTSLMFGLAIDYSLNIQMDTESESNFKVIYLLIVVLLMVYCISGNFFEHKHFHLIHETGLGIIIGAAVGGIVYFGFEGGHQHYEFGQKIFFYGLLPPIIFEGGYNLKKAKVFENFPYIMIFGVLGTIVAFFVIMSLTFAMQSAGLIINSKDGRVIELGTTVILLYSATICATDSVAALTMIKPQKYPKLFSIVFGEGMVNDAVAIILFGSIKDIFGNPTHVDITTGTIFHIILNFFISMIVSLLLGIVSGLLCTLMFKHWRFLNDNVISQIILTFLFGALAYACCELLDYSGVIAVLVCGIVMAHFNFYNLSLTGQLSTQITFKFISFAAESFLFVYLGLSSWNYLAGNDTDKYAVSWSFVGIQLIICCIGRFSSIFVVSGVFYLFMKKKWSVNVFELGIVWFAGIIRGSVAFALILTVPTTEENKQQVQIIKSGVLIIVLITTIILGASMPFYIKCSLARSQRMGRKKEELLEDQNKETEPILKEKKKPSKFKQFDQQYLKPFFIYDYDNRKEELLLMKKKMKINSEMFQGAEYIREAEQISHKKIKESLLHSQKVDVLVENDD